MKPFYVTTPIYYVNDRPHIGHAYSTIAADVLSRYARLRGRPAYFLTGLDEHGLKIERRAQEEGLPPQDFVDRMAPPFRQAWKDLDCQHDDFLRTTEHRHKERVQRLWKRVEAAGDIYLGDYEDWYCVGCESFKTEKELLPGNLCPDHKKPVERIKERSYFFRLSAYTEKLLAFYDAHPGFVQPEGRFNEVKAFVREGLKDLSVSRTTFRWGIEVPNDPAHVMYVWFDALANYVTALGGPADAGEAALYDRFWQSEGTRIHIVGKDILRFHAIFWPAFLLSAGVHPPTQVWAHGWLTVNGEKMSKSLGNFLPPKPLVDEFGTDVLRYYLMREIGFGQDGDFSHANLVSRYNGELGNGLGNLLNRMVSSLVQTSLGGKVPHLRPADLLDEDRAVIATAERVAKEAAGHLDQIEPHRALDSIFELVAATNKHIDLTAPWALAKNGDIPRLEQVAYTVMESLRWLSTMLWPFMPGKCDGLRHQLGLGSLLPVEQLDAWPSVWGGLAAGTVTQPGTPLFPRIDKDREREILERLGVLANEPAKAAPKPKAPKAEPSKPALPKEEKPTMDSVATTDDGTIEFDDFAKVKLKLGLVLSAEPVPKSKKLLKLSVDVGEAAPRQILAGISEHYAPEALVGRRIVVVANLKPRSLMGLESHGMVLAASDENGLSVLSPEKDIAPGSPVK
ncbi:MAG: methionine--tRNA ligase [Polyangiales bacterium]